MFHLQVNLWCVYITIKDSKQFSEHLLIPWKLPKLDICLKETYKTEQIKVKAIKYKKHKMMERKKKTVLGTKEDNKISLILLFQEVKTETWFYVDFIQKRNSINSENAKANKLEQLAICVFPGSVNHKNILPCMSKLC